MALNRWFPAAVVALVLILMGPMARSQPVARELSLPDSPMPNVPQTSSGNSTPAAAGQSDSQASPPPAPAPQLTPEEQRKKAQEQLQQQEKQRVMGVMATFNTTGNKDAVPLSAGQKYQLFFKSATDPWPFLLAAFLAGTDQADNSFPEYGQGLQGVRQAIWRLLHRLLRGQFFRQRCAGERVSRRSALFPEGHRQLPGPVSLGSKRHCVVQAG